MKIIGSLQPFDSTMGFVTLSPEILLAVAADTNTQLYSLGFVQDSGGEGFYPNLTVLAAPFPTDSWANLARVSIATPPMPGAVYEIHKAMSTLDIHCRYIEIADGMDMTTAYVDTGKEKHRLKSSGFVLSTVFAVLEVGPKSPELLREAFSNLQRYVMECEREHEDMRTRAEVLLETYLNQAADLTRFSGQKLKVEWLSPMVTLNTLGQSAWQITHNRHHEHSEPIDKKEEHIRTLRDKPIIANISGDAALDVRRWTEHLRTFGGPKKNYVVTTHADSDDRYIGLQFYDLEYRAIIEFKLEFERGYGAHTSRERVFEFISNANGNLIAGYSSARFESGVEKLTVVASFPCHTWSDVSTLLDCIRKMIPSRDSNRSDHPVIIDAVAHGPSKSRIIGLQDGKVQGEGIHRKWFIPNPYNYTLPMTRRRYQATFPEFSAVLKQNPVRSDKTRISLAQVIVERLTATQRENVAIVGAHRLGKTSTLKLVRDLVIKDSLEKLKTIKLSLINEKVNGERNDESVGDDDQGSSENEPKPAIEIFIPVYINASLTPPHRLAKAVELEANVLLSALESKRAQDASESMPTGGVAVIKFRAIVTMIKDMLHKAAARVESISVAGVNMRFGAESKDSDIYNVTVSGVRALQEGLAEALAVESRLRLVVLVDEVSEGLAWGGAPGLAAWRHILEGEAFSSLRWLVATTRPIRSDLPYSPVANVFREYNLQPLSKKEAHHLLDRMVTVPDGRRDALVPVMTPDARRLLLRVTGRLPYLMQVAGVHVFEAATSGNAPLVTRTLVMDILKRKVLVELSDYFEHEWRQLSPDVRAEVSQALSKRFREVEPLSILSRQVTEVEVSFSPMTRRSLDRSGLIGAYSFDIVALLFSQWLHFNTGDE